MSDAPDISNEALATLLRRGATIQGGGHAPTYLTVHVVYTIEAAAIARLEHPDDAVLILPPPLKGSVTITVPI